MPFVQIPQKVEKNLVVSAPTGSGKTTAIINNLPSYLKQFRKVYILQPTKALLLQTATILDAMGIKFLRDDSDARLDKSITPRDWFKSRIILSSYEKADSMFLLYPKLADDSLIVIDEVHLATTERALSILSILANIRDRAKFIVMSATIPNLHELADYLNADVITVNFKRDFDIHKHCLGSIPNYASEYNNSVANKIVEIISEDPHAPTIVFRASRRQCEYLAQYISQNTPAKAMPFHSGIEKAIREKTISMFLNGDVNVLVATSALAQGINTPAERVIIGGLSIHTFNGRKFMQSVDVRQMMGRAGRPGYSNRAEIHIVFFEEESHILESALSENYAEEIGIKDNLDTILLRMIVCGKVKSKKDILKISKEWFNVPPAEEFFKAFETLLEDGLVTEDFKLSRLGKLIGKHYLTIQTFRLLKPLIIYTDTSREDKLRKIAKVVFQLRPASYPLPDDLPSYVQDLADDDEQLRVLAQLTAITGDTDQVAECIKKLSIFLHDATGDKDWLMLAKTMTYLRRLARENGKISGILKGYIEKILDPYILRQRPKRGVNRDRRNKS